jgi:hypothetical protein
MSSSIVYSKDSITLDTFMPFGKSLADMQTFADEVKAYTSAGIDEVSYTQAAQMNILQNTNESYPFHLYAKILLRNQGNGRLYGLLIYAPLTSMFYHIEGRGYRIKDAVGQDLAAKYSAMAGEPFTYHDGWLIGETYGS